MTFVNPHQFFDLSREEPDSLTCLRSVLRDGQLFRYVETERESLNSLVEARFAEHFGKEAATAVANGTVGLRLALRALGVGPGDRVLVSAYSFIACAMAIASVGAVPIPMDLVEPLTDSTDLLVAPPFPVAAVMLVHVQGHSVAVRGMRDLCDRLGVPLIEDVSQALGAGTLHGVAGTLGDVAVTSFQQSKQVSSGEGGLVAGRADLVEKVYRMADLGAVRGAGGLPDWDDERAVLGDNLRMTELQAALVMDQARMLDDTISRQRAHRARLRELLGADVAPAVIDSEAPDRDAATHTLLLARDAMSAQRFCAALRAEQVLARVVWRKTFPEFGVFRRDEGLRKHLAALPGPKTAEELAPRILSVPSSKYVTEAGLAAVAEAVRANRGLLAESARNGAS
ncbi:dTDP-4-amino-4,6-dideoxygalactose transaminase [Actinocorallia herbida]|uniref:dTDP-4-amino-4,6-dideoxygalactose transaminase n=1 Tax=Actinocorallia herbida TaxID=58109 RepID=A0A3N1CZP6_9ACTN|nr:DegT/DnrJ/EryC1/StrS family aminotransferase [Actinocorallia herbida]ROO86722.1 dTDP-4-amino-4,6-dideoxygalactose transaminase [Actinocorallia herbida]